MTIKTIYSCDICDYMTSSKKECEAHEAKHLGLTIKEYHEWYNLFQNAKNAYNQYACGITPERKQAVNKSLTELISFELNHNVKDRRPQHF